MPKELIPDKKDDTSEKLTFSLLPKEEKEVVINEIYERWKDIVYMNAKDHIRDIFEHRKSFSTICTTDKIQLSVDINLVVGDIIQVLGRYRRENNEESWVCYHCGIENV